MISTFTIPLGNRHSFIVMQMKTWTKNELRNMELDEGTASIVHRQSTDSKLFQDFYAFGSVVMTEI